MAELIVSHTTVLIRDAEGGRACRSESASGGVWARATSQQAMVAAESRKQYEAEAQRLSGVLYGERHSKQEVPCPGQGTSALDAPEEVRPVPPVETAARAAEAFGLEKGIVYEASRLLREARP